MRNTNQSDDISSVIVKWMGVSGAYDSNEDPNYPDTNQPELTVY